jgi:hypothetical protein
VNETIVWDSPGGWGLEHFLPPCTCSTDVPHSVVNHRLGKDGRRGRCLVGPAGVQCPCKKYAEGDPATWPPPQGALW